VSRRQAAWSAGLFSGRNEEFVVPPRCRDWLWHTPNGTGGFGARVRAVDRSAASSAEARNGWSCTCAGPSWNLQVQLHFS